MESATFYNSLIFKTTLRSPGKLLSAPAYKDQVD